MSEPEMMEKLKSAAAGLLLPSEHDSPLVAIRFPGAALKLGDPAAFKRLAGHGGRTAVEKKDANAYFAKLSGPDAHASPDVKKTKARFAELWKTLQELLTDTVVYRMGRLNVTTYIVGKTPAGDIAGFKATQVET